MGKLKGKKIPRKLKKEFWKIESWQVQAPMHRSGFHTDPHGRGDSRWDFCSFITRNTLTQLRYRANTPKIKPSY